jgi:hypothetical protein
MSQATSASQGNAVLTLTGNIGGAVSPTAGNIDVVGGAGVSVIGNPGASSLTITVVAGSLTYTNVNASPYVVLVSDYYLSVDCSGGPIVLQFPNGAVSGQSFVVKDRTGNCATNNITITTVGGATLIDGATTFILNNSYESAQIIGNAVTYEIF